MKNFLKTISIFSLKTISLTLLCSASHAKDIDAQDLSLQEKPPFFLQSTLPTFVASPPLETHGLSAARSFGNFHCINKPPSQKNQIFMLRLFKFPFLPSFQPKIRRIPSKDKKQDALPSNIMETKNLSTA